MLVEIDEHGMISHARVRHARSLQIERGKRAGAITGIVVHQTDADTSASSLNSYKRPKANGAHFLIDKDGTIYQTAAIYQRTNHVGPLKARCLAMTRCKPRDFAKMGVEGMHQIEMRKPPGERYPSNMEAIGIEIVGRARLPVGFRATAKEEKELTIDELRGRHGIYDEPTAAQNQSLSWLVRVLQESIQIGNEEVFRHPLVSRKNPTEAQGANWKLQVPTP
ncbi:UNVERIFIED_ORG: hypothetical protein J2W38_000505 [Variovorax paradoxus]|nr:hypothetical protein [Variovorax paradoxus]